MSKILRTLFSFFTLLGIMLCPLLADAAKEYHFVLDISGNIQKDDPQKQRIAALKQLIQQLPADSKVGIWTYASQVNQLVPPVTANQSGKQKISHAISTLGGYGDYANLPAALYAASRSWQVPNKKTERQLIIISDSGVQLKSSASQNATEKNRLLEAWLPQQQKNQVTIHTLAFSKADTALFEEFAKSTGGSYQPITQTTEIPERYKTLYSHLLTPAKATTIENTIENTVAEATKIPAPFAENDRQITEKTAAEVKPTVAAKAIEEVPTTATTIPEKPAAVTKTEKTIKATDQTQEMQKTTEIKPEKTAATPPAVKIEAPAQQEAATTALAETQRKEIQSALSKAENDLKVLLDEFASIPNNGESINDTLKGQQLSEPLVITLQDGSVLVTPDQHKAETANVVTSDSNILSSTPNTVDPALHYSQEEFMKSEPEWFTQSTDSFWPLVLTILAAVNILVIVMLILGRFLWVRRKDKNLQSIG